MYGSIFHKLSPHRYTWLANEKLYLSEINNLKKLLNVKGLHIIAKLNKNEYNLSFSVLTKQKK